jgi:hypothetical protein
MRGEVSSVVAPYFSTRVRDEYDELEVVVVVLTAASEAPLPINPAQ